MLWDLYLRSFNDHSNLHAHCPLILLRSLRVDLENLLAITSRVPDGAADRSSIALRFLELGAASLEEVFDIGFEILKDAIDSIRFDYCPCFVLRECHSGELSRCQQTENASTR
jgi:hypothetical protein